MKIESPFGAMEVYFSRNNHCILFASGTEYITINNVKLTFRKQFVVIDNQWQPVASDTDRYGKFYVDTYLNLRFHDYSRNGSPSNSAHDKLLNWIRTFFLADLNRGTYYTAERLTAERNYFKKEIEKFQSELVDAIELCDTLENKIADYTTMLQALPEK